MRHRSLMLAALATLALAGCHQRAATTNTATAGAVTPGAATTPATAPGESTGTSMATTPGAAAEVTTPSGLKYQDLTLGDGAVAETGKRVTVHYTGWLTDGTKFDSSVDRGKPFDFQLGAGQVIRGWDEGVKGMRVHGKRRLTIPSDLGYGQAGAGGVIPPNATLLFEVELLDVK